MSDRIYLYPQNSCICNINEVGPDIPKQAVPIILSQNKESFVFKDNGPTHNVLLNVPNTFASGERRQIYSRNNNPTIGQGWTLYNPQAEQTKFSTDFQQITNPVYPNKPAYISGDIRTFSAPRNERLSFDRPPIVGTIKLDGIYDEKYRTYGKYNDNTRYEDIRDGQITYYIDNSRKDTYFRPLFSSEAGVTTALFKSPMDGISPEYHRDFKPWVNPVLSKQSCDDNCGHYMHDELNIRDELFSQYEGYLQHRINVKRK